MDPLWLALVSAMPIVELRLGIPLGIAAGLDPLLVFIVCVGSNIVIIPILLVLLDLFFQKILYKMPRLGAKLRGFMDRAQKKAGPYVDKYGVIGLALFVAVPLPATGAWTGCLVAYLLKMERAKAIASIAAGVVIAGIIVLAASVGVFNLIF